MIKLILIFIAIFIIIVGLILGFGYKKYDIAWKITLLGALISFSSSFI